MSDINNDTNLREAVSRREQLLPPMPADLNERVLQRLQNVDSAPQRRHIRLYAVVASILLIIGIGAVLFTDRPTQADTMVAENNAQPLPSP